MNADTLAARAEQHERWARETTDAEIVVDHLTDARLFRAAAAALAERDTPEPHPSDEAVEAATARAAGAGVRAMLEAAYAVDAERIKRWVEQRLRVPAEREGEREKLARISRIIAGVEPGAFEPDPYKRLALVQNIALEYGLVDKQIKPSFAEMHARTPEPAEREPEGRFQCTVCDRRFDRFTLDSKSRQHCPHCGWPDPTLRRATPAPRGGVRTCATCGVRLPSGNWCAEHRPRHNAPHTPAPSAERILAERDGS